MTALALVGNEVMCKNDYVAIHYTYQHSRPSQAAICIVVAVGGRPCSCICKSSTIFNQENVASYLFCCKISRQNQVIRQYTKKNREDRKKFK